MLLAEQIYHSYGPVRALRGVDMRVEAGEIHALIGQNGAGKSSLIKVITGAIVPDSGRITIDGEVCLFRSPRKAQLAGVALVDQELSLIPELSVEDNLLLGRVDVGLIHRKGRVEEHIREVLELVGLGHVNTRDRVGDLAIGERQLLEIARALARDARLLLLDEPTATLTDSEIDHVFSAIRAVADSGRAVVFVSHRLDEVKELCSKATVVRDGEVIGTRSLDETSSEELVRMILGTDLERAALRERQTRRPDVEPRLVLEDLTVGRRAKPISFSVAPGEVVGLAGQVGSGTVEVLRALGGLRPDSVGSVAVDGKQLPLGNVRASISRGCVYISHDRKAEGLFLNRSVADNLNALRFDECSTHGVIQRRSFKDSAVRLAEAVGVPKERIGVPVATFSGGNQQKVLIGRCLKWKRTKVLLLDEPTRGVDVAGRAEIHRLIREIADDGVAILVGSTELSEIIDVSDVVVTMRGGRMIALREGDEITTERLLSDMTHGEAGE